jgi:hypothetical protein
LGIIDQAVIDEVDTRFALVLLSGELDLGMSRVPLERVSSTKSTGLGPNTQTRQGDPLPLVGLSDRSYDGPDQRAHC